MLHNTSSNKENQIRALSAQNLSKAGSVHVTPNGSSFESKIPKPSFIKKVADKQPEPVQESKPEKSTSSVSCKTTTSCKDAKQITVPKKEVVPSKQASKPTTIETTKQTKDATSKSQATTKPSKIIHSPLRKVSALDKQRAKPSSPRSPSTPSYRPFVVVVDKEHESPQPFGSSPFKPSKQLDRTPPPASDKIVSRLDDEIDSPFETTRTTSSPEDIPIPILNQSNKLPKWSDFLKQLQEEEVEEKNRKSAPKKVEKAEPQIEHKEEEHVVFLQKEEERSSPQINEKEDRDEDSANEVDPTEAVFELALKMLRKDLERICQEKDSIILLDGTLRKGLSVESVMQSSKKKELLLAKQRTDFIVGVFERNNRFARVSWDEFVELVENEDGFGKGSTLTDVKFKDVQKAYLMKARTSSL